MKTHLWSEDDRDEYQRICEESWAASNKQPDRTDAFIAKIRDAEQAHRAFATDVLEDGLRTGCANLLKRWRNSLRVAVSHDGRVIDARRSIGTKRTDPAGKRYSEQSLFDFLTVEELRQKREEYVSQMRAYGDNIAVVDKLIALCEKASAATPDAAARKLHTTVEAWLGEAAA